MYHDLRELYTRPNEVRPYYEVPYDNETNENELNVQAFTHPAHNSDISNPESVNRTSRHDFIEWGSHGEGYQLLLRYDRLGAIAKVFEMNGSKVHRVFFKNTTMHRYNKEGEIVETIFVGPILTTLCKDLAPYIGYTTESNPDEMRLAPLKSLKAFFISLTDPCDSKKLDEVADDYFTRHNLYYDKSKRIVRDIKEPEKASIKKSSPEVVQEVFDKWKITPGVVGDQIAALLSSNDALQTRSARTKRQIHNVEYLSPAPTRRNQQQQEVTPAPKTPPAKTRKPAAKKAKKPAAKKPAAKKPAQKEAETTTQDNAALLQLLTANITGTKQSNDELAKDGLENHQKIRKMDSELVARHAEERRKDLDAYFHHLTSAQTVMTNHTSLMLDKSNNNQSSSSSSHDVSTSPPGLAVPHLSSPTSKRLTIAERVAAIMREVGLVASEGESLGHQYKRALEQNGDDNLIHQCHNLEQNDAIPHMYNYLRLGSSST